MRETALAKVPMIVDHINDLLEESETRKIVLWTHHHAVMDAFHEAFAEISVVAGGRQSIEERHEAVRLFQTDPSIRVFIGSIMAMKEGVTLTAADMAVFAELRWVPGDVSQAEDRIHRIGQQAESVLIQHVVLDGSIDANIAKTLTAKQQIIDKGLGSPTEPVTLQGVGAVLDEE